MGRRRRKRRRRWRDRRRKRGRGRGRRRRSRSRRKASLTRILSLTRDLSIVLMERITFLRTPLGWATCFQKILERS